MRILVVGTSSTELCGVRAHGARLATALEAEGAVVQTRWWEQDGPTFSAMRHGLRDFGAVVVQSATDFKPDWILLHYSVFTWAFHGVPLFVNGLVTALRRTRAPVAALLHEYALPVTGTHPKSDLVAVTQRVALVRLVRACRCVMVTTEQRLESLRTRAWLPRRPARFLPISSNVEVVGARARGSGDGPVRVGVFGFGTYGYPADAVTDAVARLRSGGTDVRLVLVGAPGRTGTRAQAWVDAAARRGCADACEFTGVLGDTELSRALSGLDVLVFADPGGPAARKTTLAAGLAHGLPIVAFDGPERWESLVRSGAIALSRVEPASLEAALRPLVADSAARVDQGERARQFYEAHMAPAVVASTLLDFLDSS